jgi:hypothetical protein
MVSIGVVIALLAYFFGYFALSFWVIVACVANGLLGVAWALQNPSGYAQRKAEAGLQINWFDPRKEVKGLIYTKAITFPIMGFFAWLAGSKAGYF